jgi:hypothetical protein
VTRVAVCLGEESPAVRGRERLMRCELLSPTVSRAGFGSGFPFPLCRPISQVLARLWTTKSWWSPQTHRPYTASISSPPCDDLRGTTMIANLTEPTTNLSGAQSPPSKVANATSSDPMHCTGAAIIRHHLPTRNFGYSTVAAHLSSSTSRRTVQPAAVPGCVTSIWFRMPTVSSPAQKTRKPHSDTR